jgi:hypothetical protein
MSRTSDGWQNRLNEFLDTIFEGTYQGETSTCPCPKCLNMSLEPVLKSKDIWSLEDFMKVSSKVET